jgi:hypothetical protein
MDERWEAIEECERQFRETRLRVATENIGLAKLREGLELVRIGEPLRPEFAAWRYGDQFGRRRRHQMLLVGAGVAGLGALVAGGAAAGVGVASFGGLITQAIQLIAHGRPNAIVARIPVGDGRVVPVRRRHIVETTLGASEDGERLALDLRFVNGRTRLDGRAAEHAAALLMPAVNRFGGNRQTVSTAVDEIQREGGSEGFLVRLAAVGRVTTRPPDRLPRRWGWNAKLPKAGLFGLKEPQRLALEMALHEEVERRAMAGELAELELAWRQAEEIAHIADNLLVPPTVDQFVREQRERLGAGSEHPFEQR